MPVARISQPDALAALEQVDPALVAEGRLTLLALDAVRERLGERWVRKREQIWAHAQRHIERRLRPGELVHRASETDFLIAFTVTPPAAGRGLALQTLAEILTFFLGEAPPSQLKVSTVTALRPGEVEAAPLTAAEVAALLAEPPADAAGTRAASAPTWIRTPIRLGSGLQLSLTTWTEPVSHVRSADRSIGVRLARELSHLGDRPLTLAERDRLQPVEHAELDLASLARAQPVLSEARRSGGVLFLPLSFAAFANGAARMRLNRGLAALDPVERSALVLEVEDLAPGTPPSRIVETIGFMRPLARAVMVRSCGTRAAVEALRDARVQGVVLDAAALAERPGEVFGRLKLLRDRSRGIAPEVLAFGLVDPALATAATAAGATLYSVRPPAPLPLAEAG
jgi:hypothetical protein